MRHSIALVMLFMALSTSAIARPTYKQARAIYDAMGNTIDQSGVWFQKDRETRIGLARDAAALVKQAEAVFGSDVLASPYRSCLKAALGHRSFVTNLNDLADAVQGITKITDSYKLFAPLPAATRFGDTRAWCFSEIESLR
jgi:hypothetical protein